MGPDHRRPVYSTDAILPHPIVGRFVRPVAVIRPVSSKDAILPHPIVGRFVGPVSKASWCIVASAGAEGAALDTGIIIVADWNEVSASPAKMPSCLIPSSEDSSDLLP